MLSTDSGIQQELDTCTCGLESAERGLHGLPARVKESTPHPKRSCRQSDPVPPPLPPTPLPHLCPGDAVCQSASLLCRRGHRVRLLLQTFCRFFHFLPVCPVTWQGVSPGVSARVTLCLLAWAPAWLWPGECARTRWRQGQRPEVRPPGLLPLEEEDELALQHRGREPRADWTRAAARGCLPRAALTCRPVCLCVLSQACPTPCEPLDHGPPGSYVCGVSQARIPGCVATSSSGGLPDPGLEPASPASLALVGGRKETRSGCQEPWR